MLPIHIPSETELQTIKYLQCKYYCNDYFNANGIDFIKYTSGVCMAVHNPDGLNRQYKRIKSGEFEKLKGYVISYLSLSLLIEDSTSVFKALGNSDS